MSKSQFKRGSVIKYDGRSFAVIGVGKYNLDVFNFNEGYRDNINRDNSFNSTDEAPFKVTTGRVDGYSGAVLKRGKEQYISVGCRVFNKLSEAKKHWSNGKNGYHFSEYSYTYAHEDKKTKNWRKAKNTKRYELTKALVAKLKEV